MARKRNNQDSHQDTDGEEPEFEDVFDAAEATEQVPSRLLNKIAAWKPHLRSVLFLYHPIGSGRSTYHSLKRVLHYQPPIADDAITIVGSCMGVVRDALNAWPITSEKPNRWRLKVKLNIEGTEVYRHIDFEAGPDDGFWDSDDADEPVKQYKVATDMLEQSLELAIKATNALVRSGEHFAKMGEAVTSVATGAAQLAASAGAGLAQVMEVQARVESERMAHEADIESQRAWAATMEKFAPLIIEAVQKMGRPAGAANAATVGSPLAREFCELVDRIGSRWGWIENLLAEEGRGILAAIRNEATDRHGSDGRVRELVQALSRLPEWASVFPKAAEILGLDAPAFVAWVSKVGAF